MPGYDSDVIMAAGAFIRGSSIRAECGLVPLKPPYARYIFRAD
ncbi:MAG: methionine gamma-lyase family protein [Lachnospiraceae bacterium]